MAENQDNAGELPPGINAIKRELSELEADCERRRKELLESIQILEQAAAKSQPLTIHQNSAVYRYLPMAGAAAFYLETHGGAAGITEIIAALQSLGVVLTSSASRSALHNFKIMLSNNRKLFKYNRKTRIVTLKLPPRD